MNLYLPPVLAATIARVSRLVPRIRVTPWRFLLVWGALAGCSPDAPESVPKSDPPVCYAIRDVGACDGHSVRPVTYFCQDGATAPDGCVDSWLSGYECCPLPPDADPCEACAAPQVCGVGCGEAIGCYTPGGTESSPGPNDCPACFRHPERDAECSVPGLTEAYSCQDGARPLGGCVDMGGLQCCPSSTCSGLSLCPEGLVSQCGPGDATVACCDRDVGAPTIACARPAGILFQSPACDTSCKATGSVCAMSDAGVTCCVDGPEDPCLAAQ